MLKKFHIAEHFKYSIPPAVLYAIPAIIFIHDASFVRGWLLYLGNGLFLLTMFVIMGFLNYQRGKSSRWDKSSPTLLYAGHVITILGVILSALISLIAIIVSIPGLFGSGQADKVLQHAPAAMQGGKTNDLVIMTLMDAVVGNMSAGSFVSIIMSYYQKRDQTKDAPVVENVAR